MDICTLALFGEAEKGKYHTPVVCRTIEELLRNFGNPPAESRGIFFAIQALHYHRKLFFLRVEEEGYNIKDYLTGVHLLKQDLEIAKIQAICMPGVGEKEILNTIQPICDKDRTLLITNESDFFDYMMS